MLNPNVGYMLDTNIFNTVVDEQFSTDCFNSIRLLATHIQEDELRDTKNQTRRNELLRMFEIIDAGRVATRSAVWDISLWDQACWSDDDGLFEKMLTRLQALDKQSRKKCKSENQQRDILIAETCVKERHTLVSDDQNLRRVMIEFGNEAITLADLLGRSHQTQY